MILTRFAAISVLVVLMVSLSSVGLASPQVTTVPATANVFAAGLASPFGGGTLPIEIAIQPGTTSVKLFSAVGLTNFGAADPMINLDGFLAEPWIDGTDINSFDGISGIIGDGKMFLTGVFLTDAPPSGLAPPRLDFGVEFSSGLGTDFLTLSPLLQQTFFMGNGLTSTGETQTFNVPTGATRLFLGFADANGSRGDPGLYSDNQGWGSSFVTQVAPDNTLLFVGLGLGAVLIIVVAVALAIRRRKRASPPTGPSQPLQR